MMPSAPLPSVLTKSLADEFKCKPTRIRSDQRAVCFAARAARRPIPLSTTPAPLLKPRARHELAWCRAAGAAGFRRKFGVIAPAARLHSFRSAPFASALRRQTPDRSRVVKSGAGEAEHVSQVWNGIDQTASRRRIASWALSTRQKKAPV